MRVVESSHEVPTSEPLHRASTDETMHRASHLQHGLEKFEVQHS